MAATNTKPNNKETIIAFLSQIHSFLRFGLFALFCLSIWLLNDSTEFIRDYRISNKIENVKNIETIINNPKIDTTTKRMLQSMENQIIQTIAVKFSLKSFLLLLLM